MDRMKQPSIIFVMPPQLGLIKGFATGLISLANYIETNLSEASIELLDLSSDPISKIENTIKINPLSQAEDLFVGITTTTASYQSALSVARIFKALNPSCKIVLGGSHASADAETILSRHIGVIDFIIRGEGEKSLLALVSNFPNYAAVPGLAFMSGALYKENPQPPLLEPNELDRLSITFRGNGLLGNPGKFNHVTYVSARGCPLKCAFCSVANQRIRAKSIPQIITDIRKLTKMGFTKIAIEDNFFAHSSVRTRELCSALAELQEEGIPFTWDCQTRIESMIGKDIITVMEKAGCEAVYLGVESVNNDHLEYLGKTLKPEQYVNQLVQDVVPRLIQSSIACYVNLQFGVPNENMKHYHHTVNILEEIGKVAARLQKKITIFPQLHVVYPGTLHFKRGLSQGLFTADIFESFTEWESQHTPVLEWLGEHFAHGTGGIPIGILKPDELKKSSFSPEMENILNISTILKRIGRLSGIEVFNYGSYLVKESNSLIHS
jgi:radical SAM superfamily enzyme YgiQ (UPF0313 family)